MVYLKIILNDKRSKDDSLYPIVIRITYNRSNTTLSSGLRVKLSDWDKNAREVRRTNPNFKVLNQRLSEFYSKVQKTVLKLEDSNEFSFEMLKADLTGAPKKKPKSITFYDYSTQLINELLEVKRTGNAVVYRTGVNRLINYCGDKALTFKEIDFNLLDMFKHQLIKDGVKPNTIGNYFRSIRAIYNKAIKAKLVDRSLYPFTDITIKSEKTAKRAITSDALTKLHSIEIMPNTPEWHARNYLFISFAFVGMSFTDIAYLKKSNLKGDRLMFVRRKTHKAYNIKLTDLSYKLLSLYNNESEYLLPVLNTRIIEDSADSKRVIQQWIKTSNKYLKRLGKLCGVENLTTYVARHTWATTAKRQGYSNEIIAECLGHEYGNKITNIYLDSFDQSLIDEVNEKVLAVFE